MRCDADRNRRNLSLWRCDGRFAVGMWAEWSCVFSRFNRQTSTACSSFKGPARVSAKGTAVVQSSQRRSVTARGREQITGLWQNGTCRWEQVWRLIDSREVARAPVSPSILAVWWSRLRRPMQGHLLSLETLDGSRSALGFLG